jgi:hypothetical protein
VGDNRGENDQSAQHPDFRIPSLPKAWLVSYSAATPMGPNQPTKPAFLRVRIGLRAFCSSQIKEGGQTLMIDQFHRLPVLLLARGGKTQV